MASRLLNVLKNIESGRQACINSIIGNGINIDNNLSLDEIASIIDSNFESQSSYITNIRYYDNPFEDPDLPQIDPFVKSCEDIFYNAEPIVQDGKTYYPAAMFLLDIDESMTETIIQNRNSINVGSPGIRLGYNGYWSVLTNDGSFYVMQADDNYQITHTWDNTKDLVDPATNKHYKYVIGYAEEKRTSNIVNSAFDSNTNKIKVVAAYISMTRVSTGNNVNLIYNASNMSTQYIHYYEKTKNDPGRTNPVAVLNSSYATQIVIDDTNVSISSNSSRTTYNAVIFINNFHSNINYKIYPLAKYIKTPTFKLSQYTDTGNVIQALKYLEITDMESQKNIREESNVQFPPYLKDPNPLLITITKAKSNAFYYGATFKNILLPNVTAIDSYGFQFFNCDTLDLPSYENHINDYAFRYMSCRVLKLNNLKNIKYTINDSNTGLALTLQRLEMHSAVNIPVNVLGNSVNCVKTLDLPNCISSSISFQNYKNLHTLILGAGYKGDLNLRNSNGLSRESLLDLFNKVATLEEGESYTISLPTGYRYMLTEEEIKQVTNKGWTVKFES